MDKATFRAVASTFSSELATFCANNISPDNEASILKGIPNTSENRKLFYGVAKKMHVRGLLPTERLHLRYRGPKTGSYFRETRQVDGITFSVYLHTDRKKVQGK